MGGHAVLTGDNWSYRTTIPGGQLVLGPHVRGDNWSGGTAGPLTPLSEDQLSHRTSCPPGLVIPAPAVLRTRSSRTGCPPSGRRVPHGPFHSTRNLIYRRRACAERVTVVVSCVCVCVCACVRACVRVCVRVCVCMSVRTLYSGSTGN